jgi:Phage envelope protein
LRQYTILRSLFLQARKQIAFHELIEELKNQHIIYYVHFVSTGNVNLVDSEGHIRIIEGNYSVKRVMAHPNEALIKAASRRHFSGEIDYEEYCVLIANAGVYKWVVDLVHMTREYVGLSDKAILTEEFKPLEMTTKVEALSGEQQKRLP